MLILLLEELYEFWKKSADDNKSLRNYPAYKELTVFIRANIEERYDYYTPGTKYIGGT